MEKDLSSIRTGKRVGSRWSSLRFSSYYGTYLLDPLAKPLNPYAWMDDWKRLTCVYLLLIANEWSSLERRALHHLRPNKKKLLLWVCIRRKRRESGLRGIGSRAYGSKGTLTSPNILEALLYPVRTNFVNSCQSRAVSRAALLHSLKELHLRPYYRVKRWARASLLFWSNWPWPYHGR